MNRKMHGSHIDSFYHLATEGIEGKSCQGMACFVGRHLNPDRWQQAASQNPRIYCLGKCYAAPAASADIEQPRIETRLSNPIVLRRLVDGGARTLKSYTERQGYDALRKALSQEPEQIIHTVEISNLRGRGGAGFPTGKKWRAVFNECATEKFAIVNADEGDPGAYIDRFIMEADPHNLLEGLIIAAYAIGASKGYIYLRKEYPQAHIVLQEAITEARSEGILGNNICQSGFSFDIEVVVGQGSYICGEETALLNSLEGVRPEARPRPPYPTSQGFFGKPTLINNVETLANIPWILLNGGDAYGAYGFSKSQGTKVVSLNSLFHRPGLYEIEFGITVREIVENLGGGLKTGELKGVIIGGPLAGIIPPDLLDTPFGFEELHSIGASVGHGGVIAFDEHTSIAELLYHTFAFGSYESCGRCTPCRVGSRRLEQIFGQFLESGAPHKGRSEFDEIVEALKMTSLCGLGNGLAEFADSVARYYRRELEQCFM